jgi:hypothetical protein
MALCGVPSLLTTLQGFVPATAQAFERVLNVKGGPRHEDGGLVASDDHLLGSHISNWPAAFLILLRSQVSLPLSLMRAGGRQRTARSSVRFRVYSGSGGNARSYTRHQKVGR